MRFNRLDLNLLVALDHLLTLKSVSRTAERMCLSQSAVSAALARLREYFDDPLLVPVGRNLEPTPKALSLQQPMREILVRIEATLDSDARFDPTTSDREFSLILSDYTMTVLMPHVLALAGEANTSVRFRMLAQVESPHIAIERGDADLMIAPDMLMSKSHPTELLFEDDFVCVVWRRGRYGGAPLTEQDYREGRHIRMTPPNTNFSFDEAVLSERGLRRNVDAYCFSFPALPHLVVGSDRIVTVQSLLARKLGPCLDVEQYPMPFAFPRIRQCAQWHDYKSHDPALRWLRGLLLSAVARMAAEAGLPHQSER